MKRKALRLARYTEELSQQDVANYLGISQNYYSKIELGNARPSLEQIKLLIKLLKIKIEIL